jgi:hypothetical protein
VILPRGATFHFTPLQGGLCLPVYRRPSVPEDAPICRRSSLIALFRIQSVFLSAEAFSNELNGHVNGEIALHVRGISVTLPRLEGSKRHGIDRGPIPRASCRSSTVPKEIRPIRLTYGVPHLVTTRLGCLAVGKSAMCNQLSHVLPGLPRDASCDGVQRGIPDAFVIAPAIKPDTAFDSPPLYRSRLQSP